MFEDETFINAESEEVIIGLVPNITEVVKDFQTLFKQNKNDKESTIEPEEGVDEEYDTCKQRVNELQGQLEEVLKSERKKFKCNLINYAHTKFFV
jgi:DNA mismatch repair ATPase MutS